MQTIARELQTLVFQARSHGADTQLPGVLRAFSNIDARGKVHDKGMQTRAQQTS